MAAHTFASNQPIGVIGATGQQGGAVVHALLERGAEVRALTRDPDRASGLADRGVAVVRADAEDPDSLRAAFAGLRALFVVTTMTGQDGTTGELRSGRAMADAAAAARVPHVVFSSVGGAERDTGIPHFESKWRIEQHFAALDLSVAVIRPTFFMENLRNVMPPVIEDGTLVLRAPLRPGVPVQLIAVADIGKAAATALLEPEALRGAAEIAGDERSGEEIADILGRSRGLPARFEPLPVSAIGDEDGIAMFRWFAELPAYQADFAATRRLVGKPTDLVAFATSD